MTDSLSDQPDDSGLPEEHDPVEAKKAQHASILGQLKAEFRYIASWDIEGFGLLVCRRMRRMEFQVFTKSTDAPLKKFETDGDPGELMKINESWVKTLCVWPKDRESLKKVFDEYPNFSTKAVSAISKLSDEGITDLGKE